MIELLAALSLLCCDVPDGPDRVTRNSYDLAGQLTKVTEAYGTADQADEATYAYTLSGKRQYLTDARGFKAELGYDGHDRQSHWFFPSKTTPGVIDWSDFEFYGLDLNGNRTVLKKRDGAVIHYHYDLLNRMTLKDVPGTAADVAYAYDNLGAQTSAAFSSSGQGISSTYDALGRLTDSTNSTGGTARTLAYQYDLAGNRTKLSYPGNSVHFNYGFDHASRMTNGSVTVGATTTPMLGIAYDDLGRRNWIARASSGTAYAYDPVSRLDSLTQAFVGGVGNVVTGFTYNAASQVRTESRNDDAYAYTGLAAGAKSYTVNGLNQYTHVAGGVHSYDANGNLTSDGAGQAYAYDAENRLVTASGTRNATLSYDPLGRLHEVSGGGNTTRFLYDGDELVAEYDAAGTLLRRYVHGPGVDEPVIADEGGAFDCSGTRVLHGDRQGSIVATADCGGARQAINAYDEYGVPAAGNAPVSAGGRFGYTGQIWIPELGLYYYKARFYRPDYGRFMQVDPVGYDDQINLYAYVGNDPVNLVDPTGQAIEISRNGNNVFIRWRIAYYGEGNTGAVREKFNRGILKEWAGTKGKYNVSVNVVSYTFKPGTVPAVKTMQSLPMVNFVEIPKGNGADLAQVIGDRFGTWPSDRPGWTAAHEAGHFGDLWDPALSNDPLRGTIMDEHGGKVTEDVIEELLRLWEEREKLSRPPPPKPE